MLKLSLIAVISGVLVVLSSAPYDQWYIAYFAYVPLFISVNNLKPVNQGMLYALCCTVIATNWWHSTIIFSAMFFILIVSILCLSFFAWAYLTASIRKFKKNPFIELFLPAIIWVGIERILSSEIIGIPCNIGISQSIAPMFIQSASLFGIYTTSFLLVLINTALAMFCIACKNKFKVSGRYKAAITTGFLIIIINILYGYIDIRQLNKIENPIKIALVQPVIETDMYLNGWRDPDTRHLVKSILDEVTNLAVKTKPDILVWPEGGNGYYNMRIEELRNKLYKTAIDNNTDLLISTNDLSVDGKKYNSIFSISKNGRLKGRYDKIHLIPGAEDSYTPGQDFNPIETSFGLVGPAICYESNFPSPFRKVTDSGAQLLVVSTSDAAFKKTSLTINHTRTAVFRAIENNRWVVHASNTGPSVIVSPVGEIVAIKKFYSRGFLSANVEFIDDKTIFTRYGYYIPIMFSIIVFVFIWFRFLEAIKFQRNKFKLNSMLLGINKEQSEIEQDLKLVLGKALRVYLPYTLIHCLFLIFIIAASVTIVYRQIKPDVTINKVYSDFISPLDTLHPDKVTLKFIQAKKNTCGPAVLAYIFTYFGKETLEEDIIKQVTVTDKGTSMLQLKQVAINNGFRANGFKESYTALMDEPLPVIAYINDDHYVVVNKITSSEIFLFDPAVGHVKVSRQVFEQSWNGYILLVRMQPIKDIIM